MIIFFGLPLVAVMLLMVAAAVSADTEIPFYEDSDPAFLFLGNSYTAYNQLDVLVGNIMADGVPEWEEDIETRALVQGGRTLEGHVEQVEMAGSIYQKELMTKPRDWKWVVLQEQSQIPGFWEVRAYGIIKL
jgi:hypothetical protein